MKWAAITTLAVSAVWAIPLIRRAKAEEYVEPWENKRQRMLADDVVMVMRVKSLDDASAAMSRSGS
jgi:hypothetical protein